jgi:hypothetical protein
VRRDEFEAAYAARSGLTVARLRELGRVVMRCQCGQDGCEGWQSVNREFLDDPWYREQHGEDEARS